MLIFSNYHYIYISLNLEHRLKSILNQLLYEKQDFKQRRFFNDFVIRYRL